MNTKKKWMDVMVKIGYGGMGVVCSLICIMGYYPLLPAFYGACCLEQKRTLFGGRCGHPLLYVGKPQMCWMDCGYHWRNMYDRNELFRNAVCND